jgi:hypothetical protein
MTRTEYNRRLNFLRLAYVDGEISFAAFDAAVLRLNAQAGLL